uniref:Uncharacterized protein n=1 Tax=Sphaerodactylus townsendi TaxID=933632 RepID=A0ACB8EMI1_9SAUR
MVMPLNNPARIFMALAFSSGPSLASYCRSDVMSDSGFVFLRFSFQRRSPSLLQQPRFHAPLAQLLHLLGPKDVAAFVPEVASSSSSSSTSLRLTSSLGSPGLARCRSQGGTSARGSR